MEACAEPRDYASAEMHQSSEKKIAVYEAVAQVNADLYQSSDTMPPERMCIPTQTSDRERPPMATATSSTAPPKLPKP